MFANSIKCSCIQKMFLILEIVKKYVKVFTDFMIFFLPLQRTGPFASKIKRRIVHVLISVDDAPSVGWTLLQDSRLLLVSCRFNLLWRDGPVPFPVLFFLLVLGTDT